MNDIARICLNMDGQKNRSDIMTHLHRKIIPTKPHLKNEDDMQRPGTSLEIKKETKVQ